MSARLGIVGGYLGSGKSTLLNRVLSGAALGRTAVVVNDFGSVNVDADLIASADGDTLELTNGCICCQATDDTARVMSALAARRDLDHVLCEVSGVGDPGQLAAWRRFPGFRAGPVLVCADATRIEALLEDEYVADTVARQLGSAEVVLVTKTDLCTPEYSELAAARCRDAAPRADVVLQSGTDPASSAEMVMSRVPSPSGPVPTTDPDPHTSTHVSRTVTTTGSVDPDALCRVLDQHSDRLARAKGIVRGLRGEYYAVQLAGGRAEHRGLGEPRRSDGVSSVVLIAVGSRAEEEVEIVRCALLPLFA